MCNHLLRRGGCRVDDNLPLSQVRLEFSEHGIDDLAVGQTQEYNVASLYQFGGIGDEGDAGRDCFAAPVGIHIEARRRESGFL